MLTQIKIIDHFKVSRKKEIYLYSWFVFGEKRDGFFEQQAGTVFLTFKTFAGALVAFFSGVVPEHDVASKMIGIRAINIFLNTIELIIIFLSKDYLAHLNPRLLIPESGELFMRRATRYPEQ